MTSFTMQERDLDLFILEELYSDTEFDVWFGAKVGIEGAKFQKAEHSVSSKANAKWGETDVLAFFTYKTETTVVLIEDKIAADFTDRQAIRYHERGSAIVSNGGAQRYMTVLVAPSVYVATVPKDDPWNKILTLEELHDWFAKDSKPHAVWRKLALANCLARVAKSKSVGDADVRRFSEAFASYLQTQPHLQLSHKISGDRWGFIINNPDIPKNVQLAWKNGKSVVDLTFSRPHAGKAHHFPTPPGILRRLSDEGTLKSDIFSIHVSMVDMSSDFESQMDVILEVMAAIRQLLPLVRSVLAIPKSSSSED